MQALEPRRGRPRKFAEPSRAVTLTLPEHIIDELGKVDADISRAIVRVTERTRRSRRRPRPGELCRGVGPLRAARGDPGRAIASVGPGARRRTRPYARRAR